MIGGVMRLFSSQPSIEMDVERGICTIEDISYPAVGFGTYPLTGQVCTNAVQQAFKIGYRIFDTATYYQNFTAIQPTLKGIRFRQVYLISKVWPDKHCPEDLQQDLEQDAQRAPN